ncbi:MAG: endonuclease/exonuclease/phosphatase family protein [Acidimicrobiia bacterium]|nr:endonuclease/exonuclease/phosphatase family protein [Acidimicrobiia bacterium]
MTRLRVATFNIRNGMGRDGWNVWPLRRATTARTIVALAADIVGLQEVYAFQQRYLERQLSGHRFVAAGRTDGVRGERCPVLVRSEVGRVVSHRTIWFGATPDVPGSTLAGASFPRIATTVRIELEDDAGCVDVTSTHLDEASAERRRQSAVQLSSSLDADVPQIVLGDLNADPDSVVVDELCRAGLEPVSPIGSVGTEHRFTGRTDGRRIDHILVSRHLRVVHAEVRTTRLGRALPSDHWPVVAILELAPPAR